MEEKYIAQLKRTELYFTEFTASRFMASVETGIPIQNLCRFCDMLMKTDKMQIVKYDICRISGEFVQYLSCNKDLFIKDTQLKLPIWE